MEWSLRYIKWEKQKVQKNILLCKNKRKHVCIYLLLQKETQEG
jgi:5-methylcytosine-specific restriction endonuclease McrA